MKYVFRLRRSLLRMACVLAVVLALVGSASAYTIVMRGGKRVEIPASFVVTSSTLTYEVTPGVQITLQMSAIDIPATERANNEPAGALWRRAQSGQLMTQQTEDAVSGSSTATRTITNRDLEASMRRRQQSELAYEKRRKELGLPPIEESQRRAALAAESIGMELEQKRIERADSESYWRSRATDLRTEMKALDAEIGYVRARLEEIPASDFTGSFSTFTEVAPFGTYGYRGSFGRSARQRQDSFGHRQSIFGPPHGTSLHRQSIFGPPHGGTQITNRRGLGSGASRGRVFLNSGRFGRRSTGGFDNPFGLFPNVTVFGSFVPAHDFAYERSELVTRFNELAAARAGMNARWRELEEEARRAGAPPGWLR